MAKDPLAPSQEPSETAPPKTGKSAHFENRRRRPAKPRKSGRYKASKRSRKPPRSYIVSGTTPSREIPRTTAPHGLSPRERDRVTVGLEYLQARGPAVFVSIECGRHDDAERDVRQLTRTIKAVVATNQRRAGMKKILMATVFEAMGRDRSPKFGAHIVAHMPTAALADKLIDALNGSATFGPHVHAKRVTRWAGLTTYLLKESTSQARFRKGYRTLGGSIPLGALGGDRVVLSPDLLATLVASGRLDPHQRTNAKRAAPPKAQDSMVKNVHSFRGLSTNRAPAPIPRSSTIMVP